MKKISAAILITISGVAAATCALVPMPGSLSLTPYMITGGNIVAAKIWSGFNAAYAPHAALIKKVDEAGASALGAAQWKSSQATGYVNYQLGTNPAAPKIRIYLEKDCDQTMEEALKSQQEKGDQVKNTTGTGGIEQEGGDPTAGGGSGSPYEGCYAAPGDACTVTPLPDGNGGTITITNCTSYTRLVCPIA